MIYFAEFFDPGNSANVTYKIGLDKANNLFLLNIVPLIDAIYKSSDHKKILKPDGDIPLKFTFEEMVLVMSSLIKASSDFYTIEENLYKYSELSHQSVRLDSCEYEIKIRTLTKQNTRDKLILDVFKKDGTHIICTKLTKTKIFFLIKWFKFGLEKSNIDKFTVKCVDINEYWYYITKNIQNIGINDIWIRNKEIQDLKAFIDQLIFNYKFAAKGSNNSFTYRQVGCLFDEASKNIMVAFKHFKKENKVIYFDMSPQTAATFYLTLPEHLEFLGDIQQKKRIEHEI